MTVNRKKTIKQLMAIGVQRNDADAFARTYRKIMGAKMEALFPEIVKPVMPVVGTIANYQIEKFRAVYLTAEGQRYIFRENEEEFATRIKGKLSQEIAECLMKNGAIIMRIEQIHGIGTKYTATVNVVMPKEGEL